MPTEDKKNTTIAVVTYPGVALLDLVATKTVLDSLAMGTRYRSVTVGERTEPIASNTPMRIIPEKRFEEVPDPFAIVVPGGGADALKAMGDERLINYVRFAEHGAELVSSVSTGAPGPSPRRGGREALCRAGSAHVALHTAQGRCLGPPAPRAGLRGLARRQDAGPEDRRPEWAHRSRGGSLGHHPHPDLRHRSYPGRYDHRSGRQRGALPEQGALRLLLRYSASGGFQGGGDAPQALAGWQPQAQLRSAHGRHLPSQVGRPRRCLLPQEGRGGRIPQGGAAVPQEARLRRRLQEPSGGFAGALAQRRLTKRSRERRQSEVRGGARSAPGRGLREARKRAHWPEVDAHDRQTDIDLQILDLLREESPKSAYRLAGELTRSGEEAVGTPFASASRRSPPAASWRALHPLTLLRVKRRRPRLQTHGG